LQMDKSTPVNCYTIKPVFWQKGALPIGLGWERCFAFSVLPKTSKP